ncbi:RCC1-like domain-containing protein [Actinoplanes philippinensis]|uniref:RCC1-like domain-containing protein n=1 Tax=Actinoplanes philippinensis TaxID=35752 RepID=UPI003F4D60A2
MSCWGGNYYGELGDGTRSDASEPIPVNTDLTWKKIAAGGDHTCALTTAGGLWCWGFDNGGQLGAGTTGDATYSLTALRVGAGTPWSSVGAGENHSCALRTDNTLWCWGDDSDGALGDGPGVTRAGPVRVAGGGTWRAFDAGGSDTCGIRSDSTLWCWGEHLGGSLRAFAPHRIGDAAGWAGVSVDGGHACAVRTDATLWCWGVFTGSIIGTTDAAPDEPVRARTDLRERWAEVSTGNDYACALSIERRLWCWGENSYGQLGTTLPDSPVRLSDGRTTATPGLIRSEAYTTCAIDTDKGLWCWGANAHGRPADGSSPAGTITPTRIGDAKDWLTVSTNYYHVCGVRAGGSLWCWGDGGNGQLGDGALTNRTEPAEVTADGPWLSVSAGATHTCALRTDHSLWCWGNSNHQQLGHPVPVRHPVPAPPA